MILVLVAVLSCLPAIAMACATPPGAAALEQGLIRWINQQRQQNGLRALAPSAALGQAAQDHACDMGTRGYFAHKRAGGPGLSARVKARSYAFRSIAENIAQTSGSDFARVGEMWRGSPPHWANILESSARDIGIGIATGERGIYWVMNVGAPR